MINVIKFVVLVPSAFTTIFYAFPAHFRGNFLFKLSEIVESVKHPPAEGFMRPALADLDASTPECIKVASSNNQVFSIYKSHKYTIQNLKRC